jgi:hypothetical protein
MRTQRTGWRHFLLGKRAYGINPPVQCTRWFMHRNAPAKCTLARCSSGRRPRNTLVPHVRGWIPHHLVSVALCASKVHTGAARVGGGLATHWYPTCAVGSHTTWSVWLSAASLSSHLHHVLQQRAPVRSLLLHHLLLPATASGVSVSCWKSALGSHASLQRVVCSARWFCQIGTLRPPLRGERAESLNARHLTLV